MKKEVLVLNDYSIKISNAISLFNISLALMEGECTAFLGLLSSGKSELVKVISGDEWSQKCKIVLDNVFVSNPEQIKTKIHKIAEINYAISDWTVAEYIGLVSKTQVPWIFERNRLIKEIKILFDELNIPVDVGKRLSDLSEVEKRLIDLVKAFRKKSRILIIEDELRGLTNEELVYFKNTMDRIIKNRITVVINANSNNVNKILADNYVILKKGQIIKKCKEDKIKNANQFERILLETSNALTEKNVDIRQKNNFAKSDTVYKVKNLVISNNKVIDLSFTKGQVTTILSRNRNEKERIFKILSGREIDKRIKIAIDGKQFSFNNIADFVENKIVSINQLGAWDELLPKMSEGENILMPSLNKFTTYDYLKNGKQMGSMLKKQLLEEGKDNKIDIDSKKSLQSIFIILERWYVFRPKVLVLLEPFYQCDIYGSSIVKTYINKFIKINTSVIIVKSRRTDIEDISHNIIRI